MADKMALFGSLLACFGSNNMAYWKNDITIHIL
jgi:hypothetical protein